MVRVGGALEFRIESECPPPGGVRAATCACSEDGIGTLAQGSGATRLDKKSEWGGKCVVVSTKVSSFVEGVVMVVVVGLLSFGAGGEGSKVSAMW